MRHSSSSCSPAFQQTIAGPPPPLPCTLTQPVSLTKGEWDCCPCFSPQAGLCSWRSCPRRHPPGTGLFKRAAENMGECHSPKSPEPASTRAQLPHQLPWSQREQPWREYSSHLSPQRSLQRCGYLEYCSSWMKWCTKKLHLIIFAWLQTQNIGRTLQN